MGARLATTSSIQTLNFPKMSNEGVRVICELREKHLDRALDMYEAQHDDGRAFLA